jgi:hypothetical protein
MEGNIIVSIGLDNQISIIKSTKEIFNKIETY